MDIDPALPFCQFCAEQIQPDEEVSYAAWQTKGDPMADCVHTRCLEQLRKRGEPEGH